ncbi:MAG: GNAT family N-acetyltransferase [Roseivivax sp.]|nr:GNAT family N-acetyltransferase [Roseivivax sp.]
MIRKAEARDAEAIAAFLERHVEGSMFLLGNLQAHGVDSTDHPYSTAFFLRETGEGITGVFGATVSGLLMCQLPGLTRTEAESYGYMLQGFTLQGMTGVSGQAGLIIDALPVPEDAWQLNVDQPHYSLSLDSLPADAPMVRPAGEDDIALLTGWFAQYLEETRTTPAGQSAQAAAEQRARHLVGSANLRLLEEDGTPVAMAGINARAGSAVQVGGVYVPPALRGAGRGGRAVAGLLAEAAAQGVRKAVLFAASPEAAKTYERIGFARIGDYRVALLKEPLTLGSPR